MQQTIRKRGFIELWDTYCLVKSYLLIYAHFYISENEAHIFCRI